MTPREKEIMSLIKEAGRATPRYLGEMLSVTTGYAEQLCNMMIRKKFLVKTGKYFEIPSDSFYPEELKKQN